METLRLAETLHPDMVLLDITMPPENGIKTAKRLKEKHPELIVLFLTMHEDESLLHEALRAGAAGYVIKRAEESEIIQAIHAASHGDIYVHPAMTRALLHQPVTTEHRRGVAGECADPPRARRLAPPRQGKHQPADRRPARPLDAHRREPPCQPDGQARAGQPGRAGELRRGAQPALDQKATTTGEAHAPSRSADRSISWRRPGREHSRRGCSRREIDGRLRAVSCSFSDRIQRRGSQDPKRKRMLPCPIPSRHIGKDRGRKAPKGPPRQRTPSPSPTG